ncbi:MAG TPA: hypothetical protein VGC91_09160 [Pyrinomonadaceae bacterium]
MNNLDSTHPQLLGLLELDPAGTVLYARLERDPERRDMSGMNFFSEVAPFKNIEEFRRRLEEFSKGKEQANSFNFTCDFEDDAVPVKVLVARIRERSNGEHTKSILVHIRQA